VIFFGLSFAIANLFLAYIIGMEALWTIVTDPPSQHLVGLVAITIFSLLFYGVFARFREQACTLACPYGRVMSALIDRHTVTVTYDSARGEPRGKLGKPSAARGDCVDCGQCVTVCPTGIDIRNGIQLECVNCTACIDACDDVMTRLARPRGLIRLTSEEAVRTGTLHWLTPRVKAYGVVWALLVAGVSSLIAFRSTIDILILRQAGTAYSEAADGAVANFYNVQIINRSANERVLEYRAVEPAGAIVSMLGPLDRVPAHQIVESRLMLRVPKAGLSGTATPVRFEILEHGRVLDEVTSSFLGPGVN
jgi:cytochrome c oxidase accessory protein FixG